MNRRGAPLGSRGDSLCATVTYMRIVLVAGIYPPEIGGPALYTKNLKEALEKSGHVADVALFGSLRRFPTGIRHLLFAIKILGRIRRADAVLAFDTLSTGMPAALACFLSRKPLFVRIGGDFGWESYVESTGDLVPLPDFYKFRARWRIKQRIAAQCVRFMAEKSTFIFSSQWQLDIWKDAYNLDESRIAVVENAFGEKFSHESSQKRNFLFFVRPIKLKNREVFRQVFEQVKSKYEDITLEEGEVPHVKMLEKMRSGYAVVLPSISDVTPNYIIDAIRCGTPFLITKYSAYAQKYRELGIVVDPLDPGDMRRGLEELLDTAKYAQMRQRLDVHAEKREYVDVAADFVRIVGRV